MSGKVNLKSHSSSTMSEMETMKLKEKIDPFLSSLKIDLSLSLVIPGLCILGMAGSAGLYTLTLGGIICYILDLIETAEGTIIATSLTALGFMGSVAYGMRDYLADSTLNLSFIFILILFLSTTVIIMLLHYNMFSSDYGSLLITTLQIIVLSLPLLSSTILSTILCIESDYFQLPMTFNILYFVFLVFLCRPRYYLKRFAIKQNHEISKSKQGIKTLFIPINVQRIIYILPLIVSINLHIGLYHNILLSKKGQWIHLINDISFPIILMIQAFQWHLQHLNEDDRRKSQSIVTYLHTLKYIALIIFGFFIQFNPIFNEFKTFSGLPPPLPSYVSMGFCLFATLTIYFKTKMRKIYFLGLDNNSLEQNGLSNNLSQEKIWSSFYRILSNVSIGISVGLLSFLIALPPSLIPVAMVGGISLNEFYSGLYDHFTLSHVLLALMSLLSLRITFSLFMKTILYYVYFNFSWHWDWSMQQFCDWLTYLIIFASLWPFTMQLTSAYKNIHDKASSLLMSNVQTPSLSSQYLNDQDIDKQKIFNSFFSVGFVIFVGIVSCLEMMLLEQDWRILDLNADHIYPSHFFFATVGLFLGTAYVVYQRGYIGITTLLMIILVLSGKLTFYIFQFPSELVISSTSTMICMILPFIKQLSFYFQQSQAALMQSSNDYLLSGSPSGLLVALNWKELALLGILQFVNSFLWGTSLARAGLVYILQKEVTWYQEYLVILAINGVYFSFVLFIFYRSARAIRSILFAFSVFFCVLAFEGFGILSFSSYNNFLLTDLNKNIDIPNDHSQFFFILSTIMTILAWTKLVSLYNLISCLIYCIIFGFVSTKAMMPFAFPWQPNHALLNHHIFSLPFLYLWLSKNLNTFISLWNPGERKFPMLFYINYFFSMAWPLTAFLLALLWNAETTIIGGIIWSSIMGCGSLTASFRAREILAYLQPRRDQMRVNKIEVAYVTLFGREFSIVLLTIGFCLFWATLAMYFQVTMIDYDIFLPGIALLFICSDEAALGKNMDPIRAWMIFSSIYWYISAFYHIFIRGFGLSKEEVDSILPPSSFFGWDEDVSIWTSGSKYLPIINLILSLVPYPALYYSVFYKQRVSDDFLSILAIFSLAGTIGSSIDCIRYLGLLGMIAAAWNSIRIGNEKKKMASRDI